MRPDPVSLPGELWVVSCFFNPMGYRSKLDNFAKFAKGLHEAGINLLVVEHAVDGQFQLPDMPGVIAIRLQGGDLIWQKERLLNIGLLNLPASCDKVMFCDADLTFPEGGWAAQVMERLETYRAVQPFSHYVRLPHGVDDIDYTKCRPGNFESRIFHGFAYGLHQQNGDVARFWTMGCPGLSWAFRRSTIQECSLFDRLITGGGDSALAYAMASPDYRFRIYSMFSTKLAIAFDRWRRKIRNAVRDSIGYTPLTVLHHWHGAPWNRRYVSRHRVLKRYDFDPEKDIAGDREGPWMWASPKPDLHAAVAQYFADRQEDLNSRSLANRIGYLLQQVTTLSGIPERRV